MQTQKYSWKTFAELWQDLKPPMRPSVGEIKIYEKYLKEVIKRLGRKPKILLFGATPELRDLFARLECSVTMVDGNPEMVAAMDKLVKTKNRREKIIFGDWLNFKTKEKFDLACGDHIYCNIKLAVWDKFSENIKRHLNRDGYLVTNMVLREIKEKIDLPTFLARYRTDSVLRRDRFKKWYWLYALMFNTELYQEKDYGPYWLSATELWHQAWEKDIEMTLDEAGAITDQIYLPKRCLYILPLRRIFEQALAKHFKIIDSDISKKHPVYKCYRIYFAKSSPAS